MLYVIILSKNKNSKNAMFPLVVLIKNVFLTTNYIIKHIINNS